MCRCGATTASAKDVTRCSKGHQLKGYAGPALVSAHSALFWESAQDALRDIVAGTLSDAGHTAGEAPRALLAGAEGFAQSVLIRDAAFHRIAQSGGPFTSGDRERRVFAVWESASASVERHVRLLGLKRVQRAIGSMSAAEWAAASSEHRDE